MPRSSRISRRSTAQSRFSAFFHGRSVVVPSAVYTRKAVPEAPIRTPIFDRYTTSGSRSRSPTSTRSIIDPSSSPLSCAESLPSGAFPGFEGAAGRSDMAYILPTGPSEDHQHAARVVKFSRYRRAWRRPKKVEKGKRHLCFPYVKDPKIRGKVIGSLISGLALVIILTIYLAIAITSATTQAFRILLILLTLILTIIFCHFIIRLCMLSLSSKTRRNNRSLTVPSLAGSDGFAQPRTPIPVILARDEELGLVGAEMEEEELVVGLTPPPPAYGLWRCSVRADPNLIHWQPTGLQEETRALVRAGLPDVRPPSYVSEGREARRVADVREVRRMERRENLAAATHPVAVGEGREAHFF